MDLPARLSDQQKFALAYLAGEDIPSTDITEVSWAVADEFEGRITDRQELINDAIQDEDAARASTLAMVFDGLDKDRVLTPKHRASFSRAVDRLEERGLVWKKRRQVEEIDTDGSAKVVTERPSRKAVRVGLTDDGERVGEELRRRVRDGRYTLRFESLPP